MNLISKIVLLFGVQYSKLFLAGNDIKEKAEVIKDFRLVFEGWVVGFEPTTFRTTI